MTFRLQDLPKKWIPYAIMGVGLGFGLMMLPALIQYGINPLSEGWEYNWFTPPGFSQDYLLILAPQTPIQLGLELVWLLTPSVIGVLILYLFSIRRTRRE